LGKNNVIVIKAKEKAGRGRKGLMRLTKQYPFYYLRFKNIVVKFGRIGRFNKYIASCWLLIADWKKIPLPCGAVHYP